MRSATLAVGNRRLLKLADLLEKLPPKRFDYRDVVGADWRGDWKLSCGTKACAIGWATTIPEFRNKGLRIVRRGGYVVGCEAADSTAVAGSALFCISNDEWNYLFQPKTEYLSAKAGECGPLPLTASAKQVAKHIRRFVAKRGNKAKRPPPGGYL